VAGRTDPDAMTTGRAATANTLAPLVTETSPSQPYEPTTDALLQRAIDLVKASRPMPLSNSVMVSRDEMLELLTGAFERLPIELREARFLLKEREEYLAQARVEGEAIIREASGRAEQLVQRTEVNRAAEDRARRLVRDAEAESRRLVHEAEDWCDQRLASFEIALARTAQTLQEARARLQVTPREKAAPATEEEPTGDFFDQEQT
jgi:hypothetical protein